MRNLKRALSLALASVMLLGMMVVGTSAASYPDVDSKDNLEAIEVLKAVGVMTGDDKGNFNPDQKVTRNEMAVVMVNLLDLKVADYKGTAPFTDVPAWAEPYVSACYANKIVSGASATTYNGAATVTAAEASLMMQKALGYFQFQSDFGDDWKVATIKNASKIDLFDGIDAGANTALTRNQVAQLALNTLEATMVETDGNGGTTIKGDGFEITTGSTKYVDVVKTGAKYDAIDDAKSENKSIVQLGEDLFGGDLKKYTSGRDDLGRPGTKWVYDGEEVGTYADEADYVLVLKDKYDAADYDTDAKILAELQDLTDNDDLSFKMKDENTNAVQMWINGVDKTGKGAGNIPYGSVLELYCDGDVIENIVGLEYSIGEVKKISTSLTKAQKEDGATCKVQIENNSYVLDKDFVDFDYEEGDIILYIQKGTEVLASQLAESVEGKITAKKSSDVYVDGVSYKNVTGGTINIDDEGTFYLNIAGQIAKVDTTTKSGDYAYIYAVDQDNGKNSDGIATTTFTAYVVLTDGNKASYVVDVDSKTEGEGDEAVTKYYFADTNVEITENYKGVIAYSVNSDKELVVETAQDTIATVNSLTVSKDAAAGTDSATKFIFASKDGSKMKVSTAVGYKNVNFSSVKSYTVTNSDSDILYVFVTAENGSLTSDTEVAVILDATAVQTKNADGDTVYTYTVAIDGEKSELTFKSALAADTYKKGVVFTYKMDGDYAKDASAKSVVVAGASTKDYVTLSDVQYNLGADEVIYTITVEYKDSANVDTTADDFDASAHVSDIDTVTVSEGGKVETGDDVVFTLDGSDLDVVFVFEYIG